MSTKDKIEVAKIEIKIGDKTISLKPEQAKELKLILNEMFQETKEVHHHHDHYRYWWNYPQYAYVSTPVLPSYNPYTIWGISTSAGGNSYNSSASGGMGYTNTLTNGTVTLSLAAA